MMENNTKQQQIEMGTGRYRVEETSDAFADPFIIVDSKTGLYYSVDGSCRTFEDYSEAEEYAQALNCSRISEMEESLMLIKKYHEREFEEPWEGPDDLSNIGLGYTEMTDDEYDGREYGIEVLVDLVHPRIITRVWYLWGSEVFYIEPFTSLSEMNSTLKWMSFDSLVHVPEKIMEKLRRKEYHREMTEKLNGYN